MESRIHWNVPGKTLQGNDGFAAVIAAAWTAGSLLDSHGHIKFAVSKPTGGAGYMNLASYLEYCALQHDEDPLYIFDA